MNNKEFFKAVLIALRIPVTESALMFLETWAKFEKRVAGRPHGFNPLNTTYKLTADKARTDYNNNAGYPVQNYSTFEHGVQATAKTLALPYYKNIVSVLREGLPLELAYQRRDIAKQIKTWGSHTFAYKFIDGRTPKKSAPSKESNSNKLAGIVVVLLLIAFLKYAL